MPITPMPMRFAFLIFLFGCHAVAKNASSSATSHSAADGSIPVSTTQQIDTPEKARLDSSDAQSPDSPATVTNLLLNGYGDVSDGAGLPFITRALPGDNPPAEGPNPSRLVRFAHVSDLQLADDESPARTVTLDSVGGTNGAMRAQEGFNCRTVNAVVHTINELNAEDPISFVLMGGDNADNAQQNENQWFLTLMDGGEVHCDSGQPNDIVPGPNNDQKDPFIAEGLDMPFYWNTGNHDVLVQGNVAVSDYFNSFAIGTSALLGTRDYTQPGAPVTTGTVAADPARHLMTRSELMAQVAADGNGHGLGPEQTELGKAFYSFDIDGTPLRFLVLDTACETGGDEGILRQADVNGVVKPILDDALANGKWVILASHHSAANLTTDCGELGTPQADALTIDDWMQFLGNYPNVILSMVGHTHMHRVESVQTSTSQYWEVMTSAIADFPNEFRTVEIWDEDNGWLTIRSTVVDYVNDDPLALQGRQLSYVDFTSGWGLDGRSDPSNYNVMLWIKKPQ